MRRLPLIIAALALLLSRVSAMPSAVHAIALRGAANTIADDINKAPEKSEVLISQHMSAVDKDPGALITKEAMQKMMQSNSFLPQKAGTRSIMLESQQGFNGISNYQPSGWKITETMSGPVEKNQEPASEKQPAYTYPAGLGPVLLNGCTSPAVDEATTPCARSTVIDPMIICARMMDSANYIGVGFDGRGYYRSESRRGSLIQRTCAKKATFLGQNVPDTMTVFGIFDTVAETKSFQSVDEYMSYIRNKAGLSDQKNLFTSEASRFSKASSFGANFGGIGSLIGAGIGARVGGPVGAGLGATLGGAIGGSIGGGRGSGSGSESATEMGKSSSKFEQTEQDAKKQAASQNFFAVMYVNIVLYEISLDSVRPTDINLAALKDYMNLPVSYYSVGADVKYQNFLLRWGTHYVRSAKFGGQLKITKTARTDKVQSEKEFASIAETEFQSMFATLQSKYSQESRRLGFLGLGGESKKTYQSSSAMSESAYTQTFKAQNQKSQAFRQSEFTQTTVEAQGGTPAIAEALVDFYTPAFKQLFHEWIASIKDYAKPFEFQLRPINEIFNLDMGSLFPAGNFDFGCVGGDSGEAEILIDPVTKMRYYIEKRTSFENNITIEKSTRVNCKYSGIADFQQDMERRMMSLEKGVGIYMTEGPFPTSSFDLPGGQPGCEEDTVAQFNMFGPSTELLKFSDLQKQPFIIAFNLPEPITDIVTMDAKYMMSYRFDRWFAVEPQEELVNLYQGCQIANIKPTDTKVCFKNIILTYEESTGFFRVESADFAASKPRIPTLPYWLSGTTVARLRKIPFQFNNGTDRSFKMPQRPAIPCNVRWLNSHRLDPSKSENCIHFTAASEGDLFVIFASIPRDHTTWYYLQMTFEGVSFYQAMSLQKRDQKKGMGLLGDKNLYQSFFVCVIQNAGSVTMQYGKADPDSEVGTVYSAYTFPPDSKFNQLSFYSFGTGNKPASFMDVRQTRKMPEVACLSNEYLKKDGKCVLDCHAECNGCRHARNSRACQQCKNVRVESGSGTDKVTDCRLTCPAGMYASDSNQGLCVPCAAGTFKESSGIEKCTPCSTGSFNNVDGATNCSYCFAGTYSSSIGSQRCEKCHAGKFSSSGAANCSDCLAGSFSETGQSECKLCPYGRFGNSVGMSACRPCSVGFFADKRGMTACAKCPPGKFAESSGSTSCSMCAMGYYQPYAGQSKCIAAPRGSYAPGVGASTLQRCPAGTFNDHEGQSSSAACLLCAPGNFSSQIGATGCSQCAAGSFSSQRGATGCSQCAAGSFSSQRGATGCSQCPAGKFASAGSTRCSTCSSEFQYWNPGSGACSDCPNRGLAKSDRRSCYRKVAFSRCDFDRRDNCTFAMDGDRAGTASTGTGWRWWFFFSSPTNISKVVLWRRTDGSRDEFVGIPVWAGYRLRPNQLCRTVSSADKPYFIVDCSHRDVSAIWIDSNVAPSFSVTEVEAYAD